METQSTFQSWLEALAVRLGKNDPMRRRLLVTHRSRQRRLRIAQIEPGAPPANDNGAAHRAAGREKHAAVGTGAPAIRHQTSFPFGPVLVPAARLHGAEVWAG